MFNPLWDPPELWTCPSGPCIPGAPQIIGEVVSGPKYSVHLDGPSHARDLTDVGDSDESWLEKCCLDLAIGN
ncbi:unnamed protein product [Prunus armeniaca]|uniref:Uncharacterized protein n=1 Tax=Prunus armeniaca TaxID=36596 RepID=A0A6J5UNH9_PRUAR|nr:unnamed protein product [Prunus armeniaca]